MTIMTKQQVTEAMVKEFNSFINSATKLMRADKVKFANISTHADLDKREFSVSVDVNGGDEFIDYFRRVESRLIRLKVVSAEFFKGEYDWDNDMYFKPAVVVFVTVR